MPDSMAQPHAQSDVETADALIIGAGFAGLCAAIKLREMGLSFLVIEKAQEYGGTWRDNVYPGCACDIPSHLYSLSFEPNPDWSRMYPTQPEILAYLRRVAEKHNLRAQTRFGAKLCEAAWDKNRNLWRAHTEDGRCFEGRFLMSGMGPLHIPSLPDIRGMADFAGPAFHSAQWDVAADLQGKRVAVIGTGASAIQFIPRLTKQAAQVTVFQRTPPWIMPKPDYPFSQTSKRLFRLPWLRWLFRQRIFLSHDIRALGFLGNEKVMAQAEAMARAHLESQVTDPHLRRKLSPAYRLGCKRVLISNDFYPALAQPHVSLVTDRIAEIRTGSVVTADGVVHPADCLIYGTGFHTTDCTSAVRITGRDGLTLNDAFADGMHAYWGITVPGLPNFFLLLGPNTGLGHNSVVLMIEAQMRYVASLLRKMDAAGWMSAEVKPEVEAAWNRSVQSRIGKTVWIKGGCRSWYLDAQGRNTTIWPGFVAEYQMKTRAARLADYTRLA